VNGTDAAQRGDWLNPCSSAAKKNRFPASGKSVS
jgi:hypothetical protein